MGAHTAGRDSWQQRLRHRRARYLVEAKSALIPVGQLSCIAGGSPCDPVLPVGLHAPTSVEIFPHQRQPMRLHQLVDPIHHLIHPYRVLWRTLAEGLKPEGSALDRTKRVVVRLTDRRKPGLTVWVGHFDRKRRHWETRQKSAVMCFV